MKTNSLILQFLSQNWILLVLIVVLLIPFIKPSKLSYLNEYFNEQRQAWLPTRRMTLLSAIILFTIDSISACSQILTNLLALLQFKQSITLVLFIVIGFDIFFRKQLSREAIILTGIAILALYLETLIEKAKKLTLSWRGIEWESKDSLPQSLPSIASSADNPGQENTVTSIPVESAV